MKNGTKAYLIVSTIFGVIGLAAVIYQGFCFIVKKFFGRDTECLDGCDCGADEISNDDFFEEEGYFDD